MIGEIANKHTYKNLISIHVKIKKGEEKQMEINVIPNNMEKYVAFMLGKHLVFIDSLQFMNSSLDKLVSNLPNDSFEYTSEEVKNTKLKLMKQKVSILMITWIRLIGSVKRNYQLKMIFTAY